MGRRGSWTDPCRPIHFAYRPRERVHSIFVPLEAMSLSRPCRFSLPSLLTLAGLSVGGCSTSERTDDRLIITRDTVGDTVIVNNLAGSLWGSKVRLVEELTIGVLDGRDQYVFGDITELVGDGSGGVYVFDRQVPALRHFDAAGRHTMNLGRKGEGPGEYSDAVTGLAIRRDGRVMAYDARQGRINLYDVDGSASEHWQIHSGLFVDNSLLVDSVDHTYLKILAEELDWGKPLPRPWPIGLLHLDQRGQVVDTLKQPQIDGAPGGASGPLSTAKVWTLGPRGVVVGINDTYSFEIRKASGKVIRVTREYAPLPVLRDEWQAYEARRLWESDRDEADAPTTPRTKPVYRSFSVDTSGRIWVRKYMAAVPMPSERSDDPNAPPAFPFEEPVGFDVFAPGGEYLGEIILPSEVEVEWLGSRHLFAVRRGSFDEQYIVRLRLETPVN